MEAPPSPLPDAGETDYVEGMLTAAAALLLSCVTLTVVDGDTVRCDGQNLRLLGDGAPFVSGIDTPELRSYQCERERDLAKRAKARLNELLAAPGFVIEHSGAVDKHGRPLVRIRMPNGRTAESYLLEESLAVIWYPNITHDWCS